MLIAQPAGPKMFPRRNWGVLSHGEQIGEVALTKWGSGAIRLHDEYYATATTPEFGSFGVPSLPRAYHMRRHDIFVHFAQEKEEFVYSIDDKRFFLRSPRYWFWPSFGIGWPSFCLYRPNERAPLGKIFQQTSFYSDLAVDLPNEVDEILQLFLLWIVVDRAQWRFWNNPP